MATGPEHYTKAEELLAIACDKDGEPPIGSPVIVERYIAAAQVHATLALAAATALSHDTPWYHDAASEHGGSGWAEVAG